MLLCDRKINKCSTSYVLFWPLDCMPNFTLLNETTRACPDSNLVFECNVLGPGSTVFQGNRLNCNHSANEILLLHRRFNASNDNYAICKDGNIYAHITDKTSSNCYTSKLYVNISPAMVGEKFNIECIHDNGLNTSMVGNFSIEVIQCNAAMATTVTTQTTLTGKHVIHVGPLVNAYKTLFYNNIFDRCNNSNHC